MTDNVKVKKRNGNIVDYDISNIINAIKKAAKDTDESVDSLMDTIIKDIELQLSVMYSPEEYYEIKDIQKCVEDTLMRYVPDVAREYITYRFTHDKKRECKNDLMQAMYNFTFKAAKDVDDKRDNANINTDTAMGTMLKYGTTTSNYFTDNYILPKHIAEAFSKGEIHIHDKDFYNLTETCCQIDLNKLFKGGFNTGHGFLREPQSIQSYASLACIALQSNQNEMHGGQAIPAFDYYMATGVIKTFKKELVKAFSTHLMVSCKCSYEDSFKFINDMFTDIEVNDELLNSISDNIIDNIISAYTTIVISLYTAVTRRNLISKDEVIALYEIAKKRTEESTYQAMESFIHNLNSMHSRAGGQVPFSSINYGTDTSCAGRLVIKQLLLATQAGLGNGETPIFPVQIFKVKEGVNYNETDANYDLFKLAMKTSATRLFPNFSFIDAPFNLKYYKQDDFNTEIAYMGCRTRTIGNVNGQEICTSRGNLSFTTINLPMLALESHGNMYTFKEKLRNTMDLVKEQLLHRFKIQCERHVYNYPFLMGQGVWLDSDKLSYNDTLEDVLKHGTLSIGFIGLAETLKVLTGTHHGENPEAQKLGLKIIKFMREVCDEYTGDTHLNFSLFATPAEGLTGRLAKINRKRFGTIEGVTDRDYLTNSFHVPVYYHIKAADKISIEAPYHDLCNAGHISYVEMDGDPNKNLEAFESIIRYMKEKGIGYGSINHPVDRDPCCGYNGIIDNECPKCHRTDKKKVNTVKISIKKKV